MILVLRVVPVILFVWRLPSVKICVIIIKLQAMRIIVSSIVFGLLLNLGFVSQVFANETKVSISNNADNAKSNVSVKSNTGENTVCINGECTTSSDEGESKSTVCVNGKCYTSDDGDLDVEEGNSKVHISNSDEKASVSTTLTPKPTIIKEAEKEEIKELIKQSIDKQNHLDFGQIIRGFSRFLLSWLF